MSQISTMNSWYTNAYSGSFRTNRIRANSMLPHSRLGLTPSAMAAAQQTLVVDAARHAGVGVTADGKEENKNVRRRETIFGPDVGEDDEPGWTKPDEGATVGVDVVKGWVEKAKSEDGLHATTTLQALVNLKRPTLLLQQLEPDVTAASSTVALLPPEGDITSAANGSRPNSMMPSAPLHLLKFNYDATASLVRITLSIHAMPTMDVDGKASISEADIKVVYRGVHDGGFNQVFTLPGQAALDLSDAVGPMPVQMPNPSAITLDSDDKAAANTPASPIARDSQSEDTNRSSLEHTMGILQVAGATQPDLATVPESGTPSQTDIAGEHRTPRRFGIFPRRQREPDVEEAAQIEMANRAAEGAANNHEAEVKEPEKGMRLLIRIEAVSPEGQSLKRRNAQLTHILINGMWVPDAGSANPVGQAGKRVWVVKVVRREAIIGAHTFLLKEIYGLSSTSTQAIQPTYPPTAGVEADPYASTPNECIVCLTAPRDVVLLPCRHLVVCRDCAVGMVEFGAGGKVGRRDEAAPGGGAVEETANGGAGAAVPEGPNAPQVAGGTTATHRERRKKKAKGWYCPVCRQPYTSLLRLALPALSKPHSGSHVASRAPSIRSVRSTHSLRRAPSIAPTLPDGAERMLDNLRPNGEEDDNVETDGQHVNAEYHHERPQFVLGPDVDDEEDSARSEWRSEVEQRVAAVQAGRVVNVADSKGWKEVA